MMKKEMMEQGLNNWSSSKLTRLSGCLSWRRGTRRTEKRRVIDLTIKSFSPWNSEKKRGWPLTYYFTIHPTIARLLLCVPCLCVGPRPRPMVAAEVRITMTTPQRPAMFGSEVINSSVRPVPVVEAFLLLVATEQQPVPMDPMDRRVLLRGRNRPR